MPNRKSRSEMGLLNTLQGDTSSSSLKLDIKSSSKKVMKTNNFCSIDREVFIIPISHLNLRFSIVICHNC